MAVPTAPRLVILLAARKLSGAAMMVAIVVESSAMKMVTNMAASTSLTAWLGFSPPTGVRVSTARLAGNTVDGGRDWARLPLQR